METGMTGRIPVNVAKLTVALLAATALAIVPAASEGAVSYTTIYNNIAKPLPKHVPSLGFEATSTSEFGGAVEFTGASLSRTKVSVVMNSWACQHGNWYEGTCATEKGAKFEWPITLHIFTVGPEGSVGTLIAKLTKTFKIPYQRSASPNCPGPDYGWYDKAQERCVNGKLSKVTFTLKGVHLPSQAIITVSYNTSHYGEEPQGTQPCSSEPSGCPYDSLNVGVTGTPTIGGDPLPEDAYLSSTWGGAYCDGGTGGTGALRLDAPNFEAPHCWGGYQPEIMVRTG
jgi:hypothetical protein